MTKHLQTPATGGKKQLMLPLLAVSIGYGMWGFSYLFTRVALQRAEVELLLSLRFCMAFILMQIPVLLGKQRLRLRGRKKLWLLALIAISEPVYFYCETYGIFYTNATFSGVLLATVPVLSVVLGILFLKEHPSRMQAAACLMPVIGAILMTISGSAMGVVQPIGVILLVISCLIVAVHRIINRRAAEEYSAFERTYWMLGLCAVVFTVDALVSVKGDVGAWLQPMTDPVFLLPTLTLSVFCSIVSNLLANYAAGRLPVVVYSAFSNLLPVCSMFAGIVFLKEPLSAMSLAGSVLILVGIWIVNRYKKPDAE